MRRAHRRTRTRTPIHQPRSEYVGRSRTHPAPSRSACAGSATGTPLLSGTESPTAAGACLRAHITRALIRSLAHSFCHSLFHLFTLSFATPSLAHSHADSLATLLPPFLTTLKNLQFPRWLICRPACAGDGSTGTATAERLPSATTPAAPTGVQRHAIVQDARQRLAERASHACACAASALTATAQSASANTSRRQASTAGTGTAQPTLSRKHTPRTYALH
jgi:hypothetical protein